MIRRKLLPIASLDKLKYNQRKLTTRQDWTYCKLILKCQRNLLCVLVNIKLNHKLEKTGRETKGKLCTQPIILINEVETTLTV